MMNLTTLPLSFWDYALESATRILNMVPTKKVDKTPYELWYGKVPNLSYLKVWGCEALVKWDTPDKLQQRSFFEKSLISQEVSGRAVDLEEIKIEIHHLLKSLAKFLWRLKELYTTFSTLAVKLWWRGRSWVFDLNKSDLCPSFVEGLTVKGLRPSRGGFPYWGGLQAGGEGKSIITIFFITNAKDSITTQTCELLKEEFNDFLTLYPIPSEYRVILPKSNQTVFDAPNGFIYRDSILLVVPNSLPLLSCVKLMVVSPLLTSSEENHKDPIQNDEDLDRFYLRRPSPGFELVLPIWLVNTKPLKANEELEIQSVEVMADSRESLKPKLFVVHPGSVAARIKDRKSWKNHLDNHMDLELLDLHDRCYARQAIVDNAVNKRSRELLQVIKKLRGECNVIRSRERAREEEYEGLRVKCEAAMTEMMLESQKWEGYQQSLSTLESKVTSLKAKKLVHSDDMGSLVGKLVTPPNSGMQQNGNIGVLLHRRTKVTDMKEPFDLSKVKCYRSSYKKDHTQTINDFTIATFPWLDEFVADPSTLIEVLLSKKPPSLQRPAPSRTQVPFLASQKATSSSALVSNSMSPPADVSVTKPQSSPLQ
ncbi:RNA-directed DNA polymerase, eukaryota, reverse transcriptase zinc-binding domain protein [Tanacetum coccineum]